jgi:hypothetical protein
MIEELPMLVPSTRRRERTRARCHRALVRHAQPAAPKHVAIERALCLGFGAIYLSSLAFDVMRILIR